MNLNEMCKDSREMVFCATKWLGKSEILRGMCASGKESSCPDMHEGGESKNRSLAGCCVSWIQHRRGVCKAGWQKMTIEADDAEYWHPSSMVHLCLL